MKPEDLPTTNDLDKALAVFAAGYAKRILETQYTRLMKTRFGKRSLSLSRPSKYTVESVLNIIVAWASTREANFANTPLKEFLWEVAKDAPSEFSKRLLNGEHVEVIDGQAEQAEAQTVLEGLLRMNERDLSTFVTWLKNASPKERRQMADLISKRTEAEQEKLLGMSFEEVQMLLASASESENTEVSERKRTVHSLTAALRKINDRLEGKKRF